MNIVSLDLEMAQPSRKIIEIGITVAHLESKQILVKKSFFVNPQEPLTEYITNLTSISQDDVDNAPMLLDAYKDMCKFLAPYQIQRQPVVWGAGDMRTLKEQLGENDYDWCFGFREMDVKTLVQAHRISQGFSMQGGLAKSMTRYGLSFQGTIHRANDDSFNTLLLYFRMLELFKGK